MSLLAAFLHTVTCTNIRHASRTAGYEGVIGCLRARKSDTLSVGNPLYSYGYLIRRNPFMSLGLPHMSLLLCSRLRLSVP